MTKDIFDKLVDHILTGGLFMEQAVEILERALIQGALERTEGNQCEAAKLLGIHRNTLNRKVKEYKIGSPRKPARRVAASAVRRARRA